MSVTGVQEVQATTALHTSILPTTSHVSTTNRQTREAFRQLPNPENQCHDVPNSQQESQDGDERKQGRLVVAASSSIFFVYLGLTYSYGIVQLYLVEYKLAKISTLSFVGSLAASISPLAGTIVVRVIRKVGYSATACLGGFLLGLGELTASWSTRSVPGFFVTQGLIFGMGAALCFLVS